MSEEDEKAEPRQLPPDSTITLFLLRCYPNNICPTPFPPHERALPQICDLYIVDQIANIQIVTSPRPFGRSPSRKSISMIFKRVLGLISLATILSYWKALFTRTRLSPFNSIWGAKGFFDVVDCSDD